MFRCSISTAAWLKPWERWRTTRHAYSAWTHFGRIYEYQSPREKPTTSLPIRRYGTSLWLFCPYVIGGAVMVITSIFLWVSYICLLSIFSTAVRCANAIALFFMLKTLVCCDVSKGITFNCDIDIYAYVITVMSNIFLWYVFYKECWQWSCRYLITAPSDWVLTAFVIMSPCCVFMHLTNLCPSWSCISAMGLNF